MTVERILTDGERAVMADTIREVHDINTRISTLVIAYIEDVVAEKLRCGHVDLTGEAER